MKIAALLLLLILSSDAFCQGDMASNYKIYNTSTQRSASLDDIIDAMSHADVLFFGEEHNDSTGHYLESVIFKKLIAKYSAKAALSMEMFQTDCQTVVNEYVEGLIREKNLISEGRAWQNYKDYRLLVEIARENNLPVIAANAPTRYTNMVTRGSLADLQKLGATAKSWLPPLPIDTATGIYYTKFNAIMGGHSQLNMYQSQNLWDATMGYSISKFYKAHKDSKIFQVNGGFHSEEKLGAVAQLKRYAPNARVINIQAYADDSFDKPDWGKFAKFGDFIILTNPKLPKTY